MKVRAVNYIILALLCACLAVLGGLTTIAYADEEDGHSVASITIIADGKKFVYTDELITPSDFTVQEEIELKKINAPLADKIMFVDMCLSKGADYKSALSVCFPLLIRTVDKAAEHIYVAPINAEVVYKNGMFTVTKESDGRALDENKLYASIYCCLKYSGGGTVTAAAEKISPEVTKQELQANLKLRGEYTTDYSTSTAARAHNVVLALSKLDGVEIPAGETLSFNGIVGTRTEENGFKSAKIIVDGKYTDGVGGGVCQASTALYNAALLSGLNCSANAHSICPSYCPAGLDAMISSVSDLTVTNTTSHSVYISVKAGGGRANVYIYGEPNEFTIKPESVTLRTVACEQIETVDSERKYFDETAVSGDRLLVSLGKDGVVSETYLKYYKNGKFIKRVKIRTNEYKSTPQVIAVAP